MADSITVLVPRGRLPSPDAVMEALQARGFPIASPSRWNWNGLLGWLPMTWAKEQSGFEAELLRRKASGHSTSGGKERTLDSEILIEARDYRSLQCGAAFAAVVADLAGGEIHDGDRIIRDGDDISAWAEGLIAFSERELSAQLRREKFAASLTDDHLIAEAFERLLDESRGQSVSFPTLDNPFYMDLDSLLLRTESMTQFSGWSWRLEISDKLFDKTQHRAAQDRYFEALHRWHEEEGWIVGDEIPKKYQSEHKLLHTRMDQLEEADEQVAQEALQVLKAFANEWRIESIRWLPPDALVIELSGETSCTIHFIAGGQYSGFSIDSPEIRFIVKDRLEVL